MSATENVSDEALAGFVASADDAVIVADASGAIRYWNAAAEAMFGHAREDAIGASLDIIIPEKLRGRHWDGYRRVMATGVTHYGSRMLAVPALRADGSRISVEFTVTLLHDAAGGIWGIGAILRDVTARWEQQRALRRELEELKRRPDAPKGVTIDEARQALTPARAGQLRRDAARPSRAKPSDINAPSNAQPQALREPGDSPA